MNKEKNVCIKKKFNLCLICQWILRKLCQCVYHTRTTTDVESLLTQMSVQTLNLFYEKDQIPSSEKTVSREEIELLICYYLKSNIQNITVFTYFVSTHYFLK